MLSGNSHAGKDNWTWEKWLIMTHSENYLSLHILKIRKRSIASKKKIKSFIWETIRLASDFSKQETNGLEL